MINMLYIIVLFRGGDYFIHACFVVICKLGGFCLSYRFSFDADVVYSY
jgi:hypothetical protein